MQVGQDLTEFSPVCFQGQEAIAAQPLCQMCSPAGDLEGIVCGRYFASRTASPPMRAAMSRACARRGANGSVTMKRGPSVLLESAKGTPLFGLTGVAWLTYWFLWGRPFDASAPAGLLRRAPA